MKKLLISAVIFLSVGFLGWQVATSAEPSIFHYSTQDARLSHLNALIVQTGLDDLIENHGPFTLIAPTDAAFAQV